MNGLSLKISTGAKKSKNIMCFSPVVVANLPKDIAQNELIGAFLKAATADEQLATLKKILDKDKDSVDRNVIKLLAVVFFHSEAKHPVKCFIMRFITKSKSSNLQETFTDLLSSEIKSQIGDYTYNNDYQTYNKTVFKIGMCLENFPAGACAVKSIQLKLSVYLTRCFYHCLKIIKGLSPTEKNIVYNLAHLTLKIVLHIITKIQQEDIDDYDDNKNMATWFRLYQDMRKPIDDFLNDKDVPMDTKSVCVLVALALDALYNRESWKQIFLSTKNNVAMNEEVQLAVYSAIITTVPMHKLQEKEQSDAVTPIEIIVQTFMNIVDKSYSNVTLILGVARTLLQISKHLAQLKAELREQVTEQLLAFVWTHLEYYMDSVRHLAVQILTCTVQYCATMETNGESGSALESALSRLAALGELRRGYYAGVRGCARAIAVARLLRALPPRRLLPALLHADLTSTVATTLDELLTRHAREAAADELFDQWVLPILKFVQTNDLDPQPLTVLENLLAKAFKLDQTLVAHILPHIKQACESLEHDGDLRNVLVLLSVGRASLADLDEKPELWGGVLPYEVLEGAVVDARDEVRVNALGVVCAGAGRGITAGELRVVLSYLAHCDHEPSHARQRAKPMLYKFIKRVFDSERLSRRGDDVALAGRGDDAVLAGRGDDAVLAGRGDDAALAGRGDDAVLAGRGDDAALAGRGALEALRAACYGALGGEATASRRGTALDLLQATDLHPLPYPRTWTADYVEKLLMHLDDSYETNKALALEILLHVPLELLKENKSESLQLEDILKSANAVRPAEVATAAFRLELLCRRLPERVLQQNCKAKEPALFCALSKLIHLVHVYHYDALGAPREKPTYGLLHCAARLLDRMDPDAIAGCFEWRNHLIQRMIVTCADVLDGARCVVNAAAPEGALPGVHYDIFWEDYGNNACVVLDDGQLVTAQMVLLCAWRTVKEAASVLGSLVARFPVQSLNGPGVYINGLPEVLASSLTYARHRGAIEQVYVAFQRCMHRMWRMTRDVDGWQGASLALQPAILLSSAMASLRGPAIGADRRSGGLPFLIQAIVSTEPGAGGPGSALRDVMGTLLGIAGGEGAAGGEGDQGANTRVHAYNVLRALYKNSSLESAVQSFLGDGLRVALQGFEGASWMERNASALLLSALMARVFPARARQMTGHQFFLRYPQLYDIMLNKLEEASSSEEKLLLCPSLYPVLLLLGRLYPSSLEGTKSNLKLVTFVPLVVRLARSRVLHTRRLAAVAAVPLVSPDRYVAHLQHLLALVSEPRVERNYCHGILLQICALLEHKPAAEGAGGAGGAEAVGGALRDAVGGTLWILAQPCQPLLHQHAILLTALLDRFPSALPGAAAGHLRAALAAPPAGPAPGRDPALAACLQLLLRLTESEHEQTVLLVDGLRHEAEAVRAQARAGLRAGPRGRGARGHAPFLPSLAEPLRHVALWQADLPRVCEHLEILVAEGDTQELVIRSQPYRNLYTSDGNLESGLQWLICYMPDVTTHLYLESLISYVCPQLPAEKLYTLSTCLRLCSRPHLPPAARVRAARALRDLAPQVLHHAAALSDWYNFEVELHIFAAVAELLRGDEPEARALAADAASRLAGASSQHSVVPSRAAELLLQACAARPRAAALLDELKKGGAPEPSQPPERDECRMYEPRDRLLADSASRAWAAACEAAAARLSSSEAAPGPPREA